MHLKYIDMYFKNIKTLQIIICTPLRHVASFAAPKVSGLTHGVHKGARNVTRARRMHTLVYSTEKIAAIYFYMNSETI
jgi:hypothetical protein